MDTTPGVAVGSVKRRASDLIGLRPSRNVHLGVRLARTLGFELNQFVSFNFTQTACPPENADLAFAKLRASFGKWARRPGKSSWAAAVPPTFVWVIENPNDCLNAHWLVHVPEPAGPVAALRGRVADVSSPQVIGQGGWLQFKFLFSGGDNIIYAVNQQGQLLRYVDGSQTGGGDVSSPQVIGQGGWLQFKFLFGGGNNVIYAVNQQGQLLRYVDGSQTGGGDVSSPQVIGQGGWLPFLFLFSGWNNILYAVDQQGELLRYVDGSQTGGGDVSSPQIV
jgi:hypothetical protein